MFAVAPLSDSDIPEIVASFTAAGWNKPDQQFRQYLAESSRRARIALVARAEGVFAGYVTLVWVASYASFRRAGIPELQDLNVLPRFQRQGVATQLLDAAEALAKSRADTVGIGVGLTADYGPAQRLYALRGYLPDGQGAQSQGVALRWGSTITVDDGLVLYMTRVLAD
jgi:GNAT superfamily N-acetyltransferase